MGNICGIYCIENKIDGLKYIGQSVNIKQRWRQHRSDLNQNKHHSKYLQNAWNKYGKDNFAFLIIEECSKQDLNEREVFWINTYQTRNSAFGYNEAEGGSNGYALASYTKKEVRDMHSKVAKLTEDDVIEIINRIQNGERDIDIANNYNVTLNSINNIRTHKTWKDLTDDLILNESPKRGIAIDMYSINGILLRSFSSGLEAKKEMNISSSNSIFNVCCGKAYSCGGYIWRYAGHPFNEYSISYTNTHHVAVKRFDLNWNYIDSYQTMTDASKATDIPVYKITEAIKKQKQLNGYYWVKDCV